MIVFRRSKWFVTYRKKLKEMDFVNEEFQHKKINNIWPPSRTVAFKRSYFIHSLNIIIFQNLLNTMVFTRAQLDALSREELVEELIKCSNIADQLKILTDRFDDFVGKYEKLQ